MFQEPYPQLYILHLRGRGDDDDSGNDADDEKDDDRDDEDDDDFYGEYDRELRRLRGQGRNWGANNREN